MGVGVSAYLDTFNYCYSVFNSTDDDRLRKKRMFKSIHKEHLLFILKKNEDLKRKLDEIENELNVFVDMSLRCDSREVAFDSILKIKEILDNKK
jgi:hypothetical protein